MEIVEEKIEKVFTKNVGKDIIRKNYDPLKVNKFTEEGLLVKNNEKDSVLKILKKEKNVDEKVLKCCYNICKYYEKEL